MDQDMGGVDQHELISFLDDTDTDAGELLLSCPFSAAVSASVARSLIDDDPATTTDYLNRDTSFYSSARSSLSSATLTFATATSTTTTTTTTTTATATMAPNNTIAHSFLSLGAGDDDVKTRGRTTAPTETAAGSRTSEDSLDQSHGLWNYLHHGLDGYSSPDLRQLQQRQHHKQQISSLSHHKLHLRPDSSRSHHTHFPRTSSDSGTETVTANSTTWTLRSGKSHGKSNSSGSKKTTTTTMSTASTMQGTRETLSSAGSMTIVPPPVSPSTGSFGSEMTKQEFEALPEAIQRKYFSSLERLHFASLAAAPTPAPTQLDIYCDRPETSPHPKTLKQRRKERQARLASDQVSDRVKRRSSRRAGVRSSSSSVYVRLPDKIKKRHLATEEQIIASRNRRHDIILDPADEAIYKVRRRASSLTIQDELWTPTLSVRPQTMESRPSQETHKRSAQPEEKKPPQKKRDSFYDSFRWLEEDDDLDLRLHLDDYHANLREDVPTTKQRRPSFRRHLSISKMPFGRASLSINRPGTTQALTSYPTSPLFAKSPSSPQVTSLGHARRRSRTLSLISPKHSPQDTVGAFDPEAAHYQDPEARLKLRVYLASPQKFDEAIEFGFPSKEAMVSKPAKDAKQAKRRQSRAVLADEPENLRTFLADDRSSIYSDDDGSLADSDCPKTPHTMEMTGLRPPPIKSDQLHSPKPSAEFARLPAESREMTLRMTLTRPDLRAHEDQMYGWQQKACPPGRKSQSNALRDDFPTSTYDRDASSKESIERQFAAMDQENAQANDRGVMKRFWNKVRRGPA
ncbi:hypothetical protein EsH8_I_000813 [Colletotrichum jinshuiense]